MSDGETYKEVYPSNVEVQEKGIQREGEEHRRVLTESKK